MVNNMTECPYCSLPPYDDSPDFPYCNRVCFDAHIDRAIKADRVNHTISKVKRIAIAPHNKQAHRTSCLCHEC